MAQQDTLNLAIKDESFDYGKLFNDIQIANVRNYDANQYVTTYHNPGKGMIVNSVIGISITAAMYLMSSIVTDLVVGAGSNQAAASTSVVHLIHTLTSFMMMITGSMALIMMTMGSFLFITRPASSRKVVTNGKKQSQLILPEPVSYSAEAHRNTDYGTLEATVYRHVPQLKSDTLKTDKQVVATIPVSDGTDVSETFDTFGNLLTKLERHNDAILDQYTDALAEIGIPSKHSAEIEGHFRAQQELTAERNTDNAILEPRLNSLNDA